MKLYAPINFPFSHILSEFTKEQTKALNQRYMYNTLINIPDELMSEMNKFLNKKGVSNIRHILSFKRRNFKFHYKTCHIDSADEKILKSSLIIPVSGCENTSQFWYMGEYETYIATTLENISYRQLVWKNIPTLIDSVEIINGAMLSRTDIPHGVHCTPGIYRLTCTIRFQDNEDFEYLEKCLT